MSHFSRHARALASPAWLSGPRFARPRLESHRPVSRLRRLAGHNHLPGRQTGFQSGELEQRPLPDTPALAMVLIILLAFACFLITRPFARL